MADTFQQLMSDLLACLCAFLHLFAAGDEALRRELLAYMADHPAVARYAAPDDVVFVPEIPHNATGALL
jgi:acyl-coenzyme A synthetase/AMP-(fatty) acid ligase